MPSQIPLDLWRTIAYTGVMSENKKYYFEEVTERIGDTVIASTVREATEKEIETAILLYEIGVCQHKIIYDVKDWPYDMRYCGICEAFIGLI